MALEVIAQERKKQGTGASRRLRNAGKVPGIVYGGKKPAQTIEIDHNALFHALRNEKFHASILELTLDGAKEQVLLRAVNMHPYKVQVQHVDFQRVAADQKIHMKVPLHFVGAEVSPAVKLSGALVSHALNEVDVRCLPADLPEFIEVDLSKMTVGHSVHVRGFVVTGAVGLDGHFHAIGLQHAGRERADEPALDHVVQAQRGQFITSRAAMLSYCSTCRPVFSGW